MYHPESIEYLTAEELAARLKVLPSWVKEQSKPSRTSDPIPTVRFGKHPRYPWGSKALTDWLARRPTEAPPRSRPRRKKKPAEPQVSA